MISDKTITATLTSLSGVGAPVWTSEFTSCLMACPNVTMSPSSLRTVTVGGSYVQKLDILDGTSTYTTGSTFSLIAGSLPLGFKVDSSGYITNEGVTPIPPAVPGIYTFTVMADSGTGCVVTKTYNLVVR